MIAPQFLAVGDIQGVTHVLEIPRNLRRATYKEVCMVFLFEKEISILIVKNKKINDINHIVFFFYLNISMLDVVETGL